MECNLRKCVARVREKVILPELYIASTGWQRTRGLLGRKPLTPEQGLLINQCNSVHMLGMRYAIDLCYIDQDGLVIKTVNCLQPWRFSGCYKAAAVIELLGGMNKKLNITEGDRIEWSK